MKSTYEKRYIKIDIREWLESHYDEVLTATHPNVRISCPFCTDKRGRLYITTEETPEKDKGWCFCQNEYRSHSFFRLFQERENLTAAEAAEQLYQDDPEPMYGRASDTWDEFLRPKEEAPDEPDVEAVLPVAFVKLWGLSQSEWSIRTPRYIQGRKVTREMCDKYFIGYCDSKNRAGFAGRMVVPVFQHHKFVGYQGRAMAPAIQPKYLFSEGIVAGRYLYNLDKVPPEYDWAILVEGYFDAWGIIRAGFPNVVASFGKHLTPKGVKALTRRFKRVLVMWDDDAMTEIAALAERVEGLIKVDVASLNGHDPDLATTEAVRMAIHGAVPYSNDYRYSALDDAISRI